MKEIILKIISLLHVIFVLFVAITPFVNSNYFLLLHFITVPFVIMHWLCNDNTCALTIAERKLRKEIYGKVDEDDCITCRLIEPVYDFRKNYSGFTAIIYSITIGLWLVTMTKLGMRYYDGRISSIRDLFII